MFHISGIKMISPNGWRTGSRNKPVLQHTADIGLRKRMETQTGRTSSGTELSEDCYFKSIYTEIEEVLCWSFQREVLFLKHMQCKSQGVISKKGKIGGTEVHSR